MASLCALLAWYGSNGVIAARLQSEATLPASMAAALTQLGLQRSSPWLTADESPAQLTCGEAPGQVPLVQAHGEVREAAQMALALRVPPQCRIHFATDSTLGFYPQKKGQGRTPMDGTFKHTNWPSVVTANISCGAQLQTSHASWRTFPKNSLSSWTVRSWSAC